MIGIDYIARAEENYRRMAEDSGNIDRAVDHYVKVAKTQAAIIEEIKKMAEVMAAAAIASQKAVGDSPVAAIMKWGNVLTTEAIRLVREKQTAAQPQIESGTVIDQENT